MALAAICFFTYMTVKVSLNDDVIICRHVTDFYAKQLADGVLLRTCLWQVCHKKLTISWDNSELQPAIKSHYFLNDVTATLRDANNDTIFSAWATKVKEFIAIFTTFAFGVTLSSFLYSANIDAPKGACSEGIKVQRTGIDLSGSD